MILATIRLPVATARVDDVLRTIRTTLEPTRVETGCLEFLCTRDVEDPNTLLILGKWSTESNFRRHVQSETFRAILGAFELARRQPEISIYHVSSTEGMDSIRRMREARRGETTV